MTTTSVKIDKYTIQHEDGTNVRVLRNDLPWLDGDMLVGQKMLIAVADEIETLRSAISAAVVQSEPNVGSVTGTNRLYNQHDAEQEAKHCGGSSQAYHVYAQTQSIAQPSQLTPMLSMLPMESEDGTKGWYIDGPDFTAILNANRVSSTAFLCIVKTVQKGL